MLCSIVVEFTGAGIGRNYMPVVPEPGGPGGPLAPPIFFRSVNPTETGEGRFSPPITTGPPPQCFSPSGITVSVQRDFCDIAYEKFKLNLK